MTPKKNRDACEVCGSFIGDDPNILHVKKSLYENDVDLSCCSQECARVAYLAAVIGSEITLMLDTLQKIYDKLEQPK